MLQDYLEQQKWKSTYASLNFVTPEYCKTKASRVQGWELQHINISQIHFNKGAVLFNVSISEGIVAPSVSLQMTPSCVHLLEGMEALQQDLNRSDPWDKIKCMKFNKAKGQVLHLGHGNPMGS